MRKPLTPAQEDALTQMREILQDEFLQLRVEGYQLNEDFAQDRCTFLATVHQEPGAHAYGIEGVGVGLVDAFFHGLSERYVAEHPSLKTIRFTGFEVKGLMNEAGSENASDARADATVQVTNSYGNEFEFGAVSPSVGQSSIEAVLAAVEYFLNSEKAYVKMYQALAHYRKEGRTDLVTKYTDLLTSMVRNTSYSSVIEELRGGAEG